MFGTNHVENEYIYFRFKEIVMNSKHILLALAVLSVIFIAGCTTTGQTTSKSLIKNEPVVKEFTMTSFYEIVDGKPKPQFSLSEIIVNKGDTVRIKITNTKGTHDFTIDEYKVYAETPLNEEVVVEFTADKAGEFVYYCAKPGHRAGGQWGTLKVLE